MHPLIWPYTKIVPKSIPNHFKIHDFFGRIIPDNLYTPMLPQLSDAIHRKFSIQPCFSNYWTQSIGNFLYGQAILESAIETYHSSWTSSLAVRRSPYVSKLEWACPYASIRQSIQFIHAWLTYHNFHILYIACRYIVHLYTISNTDICQAPQNQLFYLPIFTFPHYYTTFYA